MLDDVRNNQTEVSSWSPLDHVLMSAIQRGCLPAVGYITVLFVQKILRQEQATRLECHLPKHLDTFQDHRPIS